MGGGHRAPRHRRAATPSGATPTCCRPTRTSPTRRPSPRASSTGTSELSLGRPGTTPASGTARRRRQGDQSCRDGPGRRAGSRRRAGRGCSPSPPGPGPARPGRPGRAAGATPAVDATSPGCGAAAASSRAGGAVSRSWSGSQAGAGSWPPRPSRPVPWPAGATATGLALSGRSSLPRTMPGTSGGVRRDHGGLVEAVRGRGGEHRQVGRGRHLVDPHARPGDLLGQRRGRPAWPAMAGSAWASRASRSTTSSASAARHAAGSTPGGLHDRHEQATTTRRPRATLPRLAASGHRPMGGPDMGR